MTRDISLHQRTNKIEISSKDSDLILLQSILPSRRKWKKLSQKERSHPNKFNDSIEKNQQRIWKSYVDEKYWVTKKGKTPEDWYVNLLEFCKKIRGIVENVETNSFSLAKPEIYPLLKSVEKNKFIYRPITKYSLEDKIITSAFARYLTIKFDNIFLDCSFAFRSRKKGKIPNHHDSILKILNYRKRHKKLWVAECDIQKFFDTVQHVHLEGIFRKRVAQLKSEGHYFSSKAIRLFNLFLDSYSFNKDVLPKNYDPTFFKKRGVPPGEFGWVSNELKTNFGINYTDVFKIGVPQGNAVSCFISNLILNEVDKDVLDIDKDLLYVRYCDDMVLAHTDKLVCKNRLEVYKKGIHSNFLLYHPHKQFKDYKKNPKAFWSKKIKSKEPYFWSNPNEGVLNVPWLSFVGYQINYKGKIRVRKSSIQKEIKKQRNETQRVLHALGMDKNRSLKNINKFSRKSKQQIIYSHQQRLMSMSVGRVELYNYQNNINQGLCWINGFRVLKNNKIVSKQLKLLDKKREQQISYLKRELRYLKKKKLKQDKIPKHRRNIYYGKPFSYYQFISKD
ncbi:reverse transcriptase domain-containing protein [Allomuricauda sp. F6463D]|uniref:reverse transcriptase domain-containing protein n=1 Tax=Allomuricauda sp. F6463D TaxID=2926409 RepID=UPI001FF62274|nr:reverse transcriptase domain-containing protein [Muricauda sp. F6463D]MCK0159592.1 reverse transcriptase domain-containing protein [Muricauda sp. F6463D]